MNISPQKILVIGSHGFLGSFLHREVSKTVHDLPHIHRNQTQYPFSLQNPQIDNWELSWENYQYAAICSAVTNVSYCQNDPHYSYECNVVGTLRLGEKLLEKGVIPIFFSSDYVFDGKKGNYTEESAKNPLNSYGEQKAIFEDTVPKIFGNEYLLLRLPKVYSVTFHRNSFLYEICRKLTLGEKILAAYDQIFTPINVEDLLRSIFLLVKNRMKGLFNLSGADIVSRMELSNYAASQVGGEFLIEKISLKDLGEGFLRPLNTSLSSNKFHNLFSTSFRSIFADTKKIFQQLRQV